MASSTAQILEHGIIATLDAPMADSLVEWARALEDGGVHVAAVPLMAPEVLEITAELAAASELLVGVTGLTHLDQVTTALAASPDFVVTGVASPALIAACKDRGLTVIACGATPTELAAAADAGADLLALSPAGVFGPAYLEAVTRALPRHPILLAAGGVDVENAPLFLERGAAAVLVDRGLFPDTHDPAAAQVIRARASALAELCAEALGVPSRISLSDVL
jgi:2-dehydro-3-deoxyphosphogluconate aldolase/(4S)-4-hydroxy-2-oxoglutarate aldolase